MHLPFRGRLPVGALALLLGACGGGSKGPAGSGGAPGIGGSGSAAVTGGTSGGGSASTGGAPATGGVASAAGGRAGTGGRYGSGGATGSGGRTGSGGSSGSGGVTPTGGSRASGGAGAGGATGTGGDGGTAGNTRAGGATGGRTGAGGSTHSGTWRIMPLGDSITVTTCYPQFLFKQLADAGKTNFVFVGGNQCNQICGSGIPNTVCEGQGGMWATHLMSGGASASLLPQWCNADQADVALMHFGTNDIWGTQPTQKILDAFSEIVDALRAAVPGVVVFVAQIIPMNPTNCTSCETRLEELNAAIPAWATGKSTAASPIYPVDLWSSLPVATYLPNTTLTDDGVHPKPSAAQLMADAWYQALSSRGMP